VAGIYVDTSALGRVVLGEPDAQTIRAKLAQFDPWLANELLVVELRRLASREGVLPQAERTLAAVNLVPLTRALLERASRLAPFARRDPPLHRGRPPQCGFDRGGAHVRPPAAGRMSAPRDHDRSAGDLTCCVGGQNWRFRMSSFAARRR
jgi:hypothetical protein